MRSAIETWAPRSRQISHAFEWFFFGIADRTVTDLSNWFVLPTRTVDERYVGPVVAVSCIGRRIDHNSRTANIVVVERGAEASRQLPSRVVGAAGRRSRAAAEAESHQLILRVEIRLRDASDALRCVVHGAWKFIRDTLSASIDSSGVGDNHSASRIHQSLDHGVRVLRSVSRLRSVGPGRNTFADFTQTRDEFRDVTVLRVVWRAAEIPDNRVGILRIGDAARGPDVLNDGAVAFLRPCARKQSFGNDAALQRLILMMVRRDESGHDDSSRTVDDLGIGDRDVRCNLGDRFTVDQDVGLLEVSELRVERQHHASAQQNSLPTPISDQPLKSAGVAERRLPSGPVF